MRAADFKLDDDVDHAVEEREDVGAGQILAADSIYAARMSGQRSQAQAGKPQFLTYAITCPYQ
jgi:hypothetical protein